ncbi:hypothetical protein AYM17_00185 [Coxiella burnetii]|uniref:Hypothetical cytosolic protein n=1 Tax=Coxiella burnetii (strain Dugway 5J108-111) TaxID=434922 RepID=B5XHN7_COXBN|nr:hypothetical cytosolic protein [Coxiella burnetii Dugway 5J108-111]ACJ17504.1 hypothetical cytosolic protein [Coxiella burnetii CbuG_Q212]ACJ19370.1 hypothetical cytosolic protein [Coxiella burnetii CbuK_Q154]APQ66970.1 DUF1658 domain-containing protein [Coxiella burnetii 'MSU Goat Q177']ATN65980.1 hypothetical protein AYM17_00185 [Coxiella burnetii]ATN85043.1 hypothetical protein AYO29_00185 [Coxiella burnetii str. Schperling]
MVKGEKLKTRRPPARPSAVILKNTKPSRPSREDPD